MDNKRLSGKTVYLLAWLILLCGGILVQTGTADYMWQMIYQGIYGQPGETEHGKIYRDNNREPDVYCYMDYWETQIQDVCADGEKYGQTQTESTASSDDDKSDAEDQQDKQADKKDKGSIQESRKAVTAMSDITDSYIDMDADTLLSYCYNAVYPKCVKKDELNAENLLGKDLSLDMNTGGYKVLIYHTHSSEAFADSRQGEVDDTVVGLGQQLADILTNTYGISVYHDTTQYDMLGGTWDRNAAYDYSREGVAAILEANPSIEVIIDLHRDGVPDDTHLVTEVDGKPTAQIMLLNGMCRDEEGNDVDYWSNDNKVDNMSLALQTYLAGRANYGDMMRRIYISTCRYNMDLMPRAMLAEIGAQTNTVEEERNAIEPFAAMLAKVLLK